ncbi:MAG: GAF domain-containing protein [Anaerolineales bacterium]|nr:GAF domain-containing protein [Anaerolineales bacterium]
MNAANGRFSALISLQQQSRSASTDEAVSELIASLERDVFPGSQAARRPAPPAASETSLCAAIDDTGDWLCVQFAAAPDDAAASLVALAAAVLRETPFYQARRQERLRAIRRLRVLQQLSEAAQPLQPVKETLAQLFLQMQRIFEVNSGFIALYDAQQRTLSFPELIENGVPVSLPPLSSLDENSLAAWVLVNNRPYVTGNWADDDKPVPGISQGKLPASVMIVPLVTRHEVIGVLSVQSTEANRFDGEAFELFRAVAEQCAVLIRNAQQYDEAHALVHEGMQDYQTAVSLRQAIAVIGTSLDVKVILRNMLIALGDLIHYDTAYVFLWRDGQVQHSTGYDYYERPLPISPDEARLVWQDNPLVQIIFETKEPLLLPDAQADPRWPTFSGSEQIGTWLGIPLVTGGQILGLLLVMSARPAAFSRHEEWRAVALAAHGTVALQNAYLHLQTEQQLRELGTLYQASATMTANLDQDFVLQTVVTEMVRAVQVDSCSIFVWDEAHQNLYLAAHENQLSPGSHTDEARIGLRHIDHLEEYPIVQRVFETQEIHSLRYDNAFSPHHIALLQAAELKSVLLVPLVRRQQVLGLLALGQVTEPRTFTQRELRLTENLAGQAAVAIEHARLFAQAQRRVEELSTFHEIVLRLNTPLKLNEVLDSITEAALKLVDANNMHIFLYEAETQKFSYGSALWIDGGRKPAVSSPRGNGITMMVVRQGSPIVINDALNHPLYQSSSSRAWGICAIAGFPLKQDGQVIGVFTTTYLRPHTFTEEELLLLNLLADQAAVAVKNARLYDESQRRLHDMSALVDMAKQVTSNLKLESVLQTTVQILRQLLNARASTITMLSKDGTELIVEAAAGISPEFIKTRMKLSEGVSGEVVRRVEPIYIRDTYREPDFLFFDEIVRSLLVVPLVIRDKARGTLTIDSDRPHAFSQSDIQLMTIAAAQVSIAISNARLFEELEERAAELAEAYEELKENDRLKDELVQNVSHELRTPLTFVKGYVDLLMDGEMGLMNAAQQEALQIVATKTDEITRLIDDIMTLQRIDTGNLQLEQASLGELVKTAVAGHSLVADKRNLTIQPDIKNDSSLRVDKGRINQVLDNLIGNAIKFSPEGGTIRVELEDYPDYALLRITN